MVPAEAQRDTFAIVGGTPSVSRREVQWTIVLRPMRGVHIHIALATVSPCKSLPRRSFRPARPEWCARAVRRAGRGVSHTGGGAVPCRTGRSHVRPNMRAFRPAESSIAVRPYGMPHALFDGRHRTGVQV